MYCRTLRWFAVALAGRAATLVILILALLTVNTSARSEEAPVASQSRVRGLFLRSDKDCANQCKAVCENPCKQWANGQPDFQYSYDHCVQTCPKQAYCG
jgi:hypothetical protein